MKRMTFIAVFLAGLVNSSTVISAENREWIYLFTNAGQEISVKAGSGDLAKMDTGEPIVRVVFKAHDQKRNKTLYGRHFIKEADCDAGMGTIYTNDLEGNFITKGDFVLGDNAGGAVLGAALCGIYKEYKKNLPK